MSSLMGGGGGGGGGSQGSEIIQATPSPMVSSAQTPSGLGLAAGQTLGSVNATQPSFDTQLAGLSVEEIAELKRMLSSVMGQSS